jgi:hypothetical protein
MKRRYSITLQTLSTARVMPPQYSNKDAHRSNHCRKHMPIVIATKERFYNLAFSNICLLFHEFTDEVHRNNPAYALTFIQTPPTPNPNPRRKAPEFTYIHLLLLRLKEQGTDVLISINIPHYPGEYEKASSEGEQTRLMKDSAVVKDKVLETFEVKDWGLFEG